MVLNVDDAKLIAARVRPEGGLLKDFFLRVVFLFGDQFALLFGVFLHFELVGFRFKFLLLFLPLAGLGVLLHLLGGVLFGLSLEVS